MRRILRLRRPAEFARVRLDGQSQHHSMFVLNFLPNGQQYNRYGFVTSKRLGNAVTRNRARRLLRESVRQIHPSICLGYDVVFVAREGVTGQEFRVVHKEVKKALGRVDLLAQPDDWE